MSDSKYIPPLLVQRGIGRGAADSPDLIHVVEDDEAVRESLRAVLESYGFAVATYASGSTFLAQFQPSPRTCIVLDMHMPIMSGLDTLLQLRENGGRDIPAIMMTAWDGTVVQDRVSAMASTAYLEKPFNGETLVDVIRSLMD